MGIYITEEEVKILVEALKMTADFYELSKLSAKDNPLYIEKLELKAHVCRNYAEILEKAFKED